MRQAEFERKLLDWGLCGTVPNSRSANLRAIRRMLDGDAFYTFGITRVFTAAAAGILTEAAVIDVMAAACGLPGADAFLSEWGYIAPPAAYEGLKQACLLLSSVLGRKGRIAFGTGHPGSMVGCYNRLADYVRAQGGAVVRAPVGANVGIDWYLDYVGSVAVTSDGCGILHGHSTRPMEHVLDVSGPVDLVIADHGHAGAAINAGIPTIALMDTNDPALAIAHHLGARDLVVVPLYDNRMNGVTEQLAELFQEMIRKPENQAQHVERDR